MQKALIFLAFFALAFAQTQNGFNEQFGPFTVQNLTNKVPYAGTLIPYLSEANAYHADLYSFFVPENAAIVSVYLANLNSAECDYLDLRIRTEGLPCPDAVYYEEYGWICSDVPVLDDGVGEDPYTEQYYPGDTDDLFSFEVNRNWYFSVAREDYYYYGEACTYTLEVTVNSTCPVGTVAQVDDGDDVVCGPYYTFIPSFPYSFNISSNSSSYESEYKITVPDTTVGHIFVQLNSTDVDFYLYGAQYRGASDYGYYCYLDDYSYDIGEGYYYVYDFYCYVPRAGDFFITINNDDGMFNLSRVLVDILDCPTGFGGYNCTYPSVAWNRSVSTQTFFVPYNDNSDNYLSYPFYYTYLDIPANFTGPDMVITVTNPAGDYGTAYVRLNGYPEEEFHEGDITEQGVPATFILNDFDFYVGGRYYIGLSCDEYPTGANGCNFTVTTNATGGSSTTASATTAASTTATTTSRASTTASTTATTTARASTTATTTARATTAQATTLSSTTAQAASSDAGVLIPCLFALIVAVLAL